MSTKERRQKIIDSGSPLGHHSLNQQKIKIGDEGEKRLANSSAFTTQQDGQQQPQSLEDILLLRLPLSEKFRQVMPSKMIEIAKTRVENEGTTPIPQRIRNIVNDVDKIYRLAKDTGVGLDIIDPAQADSLNIPVRTNTSKYPSLFPYEVFFAVFKKMPRWHLVPEADKRLLIHSWSRSYIINLTSCDFTLPPEELVQERVETYSYVLHNLALPAYHFLPKFKQQLSDYTFTLFLDVARKYLRG